MQWFHLVLLPDSHCPSPNLGPHLDCTSHSVLLHLPSNSFRHLTLITNPWCSSGALLPNATFIQTGGFDSGDCTAHFFTPSSSVHDLPHLGFFLTTHSKQTKSPIMASFVVLLSPSILFVSAHNITAMLGSYPDYSLFNSYLTQTKVSNEINSHTTVTVLTLPNAAMSSLTAKHTLASIKNARCILVLLDYYDPTKLHDLLRGTTLTTTLYQTTGNASSNSGFVNITNLRGGKVAFGPSVPNSKLMADYTKSVKQLPYNISVIEFSSPITFPGLIDAPSAATANITTLLEKAGCKTVINLIQTSSVLKMYETAKDKGFTLFSPNDEVF